MPERATLFLKPDRIGAGHGDERTTRLKAAYINPPKGDVCLSAETDRCHRDIQFVMRVGAACRRGTAGGEDERRDTGQSGTPDVGFQA